jgi:hypothetical protein
MGGHREVTMRFELNFAAVVRNVAVMANVAILAVERFVAGYQPELHPMPRLHQRITETLRFGTRSGWCGSCRDLFDGNGSSMGLALVRISSDDEMIASRRQQSLRSKRQFASSNSTFGS